MGRTTQTSSTKEGDSMGTANQLSVRRWYYSIPAGIWTMTGRGGEPLACYAKTVYCYLWSRAGKDATAFPSLNRIAADCSISRRTAQYAIRELEEAGLLRVEERFRNGRQTTNLYCLEAPEDALLTRGAPDARADDARPAREGCTSCTLEDAPDAPELDPHDPDPQNNNSAPKDDSDRVVVVLNAYKGIASDLTISEASKWIQIYGIEKVSEKIQLLQDQIKEGHRIRRPKGWLAKALKDDWAATEDREESERRNCHVRTRQIIKAAVEAESRRADAETVGYHIKSAKAALGLL